MSRSKGERRRAKHKETRLYECVVWGQQVLEAIRDGGDGCVGPAAVTVFGVVLVESDSAVTDATEDWEKEELRGETWGGEESGYEPDIAPREVGGEGKRLTLVADGNGWGREIGCSCQKSVWVKRGSSCLPVTEAAAERASASKIRRDCSDMLLHASTTSCRVEIGEWQARAVDAEEQRSRATGTWQLQHTAAAVTSDSTRAAVHCRCSNSSSTTSVLLLLASTTVQYSSVQYY